MNTSALLTRALPLPVQPNYLGHDTTRFILDRLRRAVIVIDSHAVPVFVNALATEVLMRGDVVSIHSGRLMVSSRKARVQFDTFIDRDVQGSQSAPDTLMLRLERGCELPASQLLAMRLDGAGTSDGPAPSFIILLFEPHANRHIETRVLIELHGLSHAEARVAAMLFECRSIKQTACRLSISMGTAKTHLKHVFQKCEVCSQAELLQLLALGPCTF
jgi:DNA-binding CsgD family transcriptional regulator